MGSVAWGLGLRGPVGITPEWRRLECFAASLLAEDHQDSICVSSRPRLPCATTRAGLWLRTVQCEMRGRVRPATAAQSNDDHHAPLPWALPTIHFSALPSQHYP